MNAQKAIARARSALILSQPFFGVLALHLELVEDPKIETMATDGKRLVYAPSFVAELSERELEGVLAHEVMHCASMHHTRRGSRDHDEWNVACDHAINGQLLACGFTLPADRLFDPEFRDMSAEEIYAARKRRQQQRPQNGQGQPQNGNGAAQGQPGAQGANGRQQGAQQPGGPSQGQSGAQGQQPGNGGAQGAAKDPGRCGAVLDAAPDHAPAEKEASEAEWKARIRQAVAVARAQGAGKVPGDLARIVEATAEPKADWRALLRAFIDDSQTRAFSWSQPSRRFLAMGMVLPGSVPDALQHVVALVDTSGSISHDVLNSFGSECAALLNEGLCDRLTVVFCDTRVHGVQEFSAGDVVELKPQGGGGGTLFSPAFKWTAENASDASVIVYLTDLECNDWGQEPTAPVLWAAYGPARRVATLAPKVPFGEVVHVSD